jgi:phosphate/sulfate permease
MLEGIIVLWVLLAIGAGAVAHAKGRSGFGYFVLSIVTSPIVGFIIAAAIPSLMYIDRDGVRRRVVQEPPKPIPEPTDAQKRGERTVAIVVLCIVMAVALVAVAAQYSGH